MTRSNLKFDASSSCKHPTRTGPSTCRTRSSKNVGEPEFRLTRVLRFPPFVGSRFDDRVVCLSLSLCSPASQQARSGVDKRPRAPSSARRGALLEAPPSWRRPPLSVR
eukprot:8940674-Pyramimonas_sp.AAC.1